MVQLRELQSKATLRQSAQREILRVLKQRDGLTKEEIGLQMQNNPSADSIDLSLRALESREEVSYNPRSRRFYLVRN
jgi:hypothetical protein